MSTTEIEEVREFLQRQHDKRHVTAYADHRARQLASRIVPRDETYFDHNAITRDLIVAILRHYLRSFPSSAAIDGLVDHAERVLLHVVWSRLKSHSDSEYAAIWLVQNDCSYVHTLYDAVCYPDVMEAVRVEAAMALYSYAPGVFDLSEAKEFSHD
jgi:hypothetical protein